MHPKCSDSMRWYWPRSVTSNELRGYLFSCRNSLLYILTDGSRTRCRTGLVRINRSRRQETTESLWWLRPFNSGGIEAWNCLASEYFKNPKGIDPVISLLRCIINYGRRCLYLKKWSTRKEKVSFHGNCQEILYSI